MRLLSIYLRNFMRFKKAHLKLENRGLVLIEGLNLDDESANSNGTGKSTLVDAVFWCLYGVTTHEPSAEGDDVVNDAIGKNCQVLLRFERDGEEWQVTRRRAWAKGKKAQLHLDYLSRGTEDTEGSWEDKTRGTMRVTQDAINRLVGMSVSTFRSSCIFGQGKSYRFSRLTDAEKKSVLDEMLGSEVYAQASQVAADRAAQTERELDKAQTSLETALASLEEARDRLAKLEDKAKDAERVANEEREQIKRELETIEAQWAKLGESASAGQLREELAKAKEEEAHISSELVTISASAIKAKAELERLQSDRQKLLGVEAAECLLCKQYVSEAHVTKQLERLNEDIRRSADLAKQQKSKSSEVGAVLANLQRVTDRCRDEIAAVTAQAHKRERIEDQIKALTKKAKATDTSPHWEDLISEAKGAIAKLKEKRKAERSFVKQRKRELAQLRFWQAGFGAKGLRSLLLDSALPYLNAKLINYANALTAGNIAVEFRTQRKLKGGGLREDFHVHVTNKHGAAKYSMNSEGERAKIDLVVGLALQDMAATRSCVPVNVAFFDEVFDGLDERGINRAVQVLSELKRESAFVITHSDGLKTFFQNTITVVKKNGVSRIEGEDL